MLRVEQLGPVHAGSQTQRPPVQSPFSWQSAAAAHTAPPAAPPAAPHAQSKSISGLWPQRPEMP